MKSPLFRSIALLLIPCLFAEPCAASMFNMRTQTLVSLENQALAPVALAAVWIGLISYGSPHVHDNSHLQSRVVAFQKQSQHSDPFSPWPFAFTAGTLIPGKKAKRKIDRDTDVLRIAHQMRLLATSSSPASAVAIYRLWLELLILENKFNRKGIFIYPLSGADAIPFELQDGIAIDQDFNMKTQWSEVEQDWSETGIHLKASAVMHHLRITIKSFIQEIDYVSAIAEIAGWKNGGVLFLKSIQKFFLSRSYVENILNLVQKMAEDSEMALETITLDQQTFETQRRADLRAALLMFILRLQPKRIIVFDNPLQPTDDLSIIMQEAGYEDRWPHYLRTFPDEAREIFEEIMMLPVIEISIANKMVVLGGALHIFEIKRPKVSISDELLKEEALASVAVAAHWNLESYGTHSLQISNGMQRTLGMLSKTTLHLSDSDLSIKSDEPLYERGRKAVTFLIMNRRQIIEDLLPPVNRRISQEEALHFLNSFTVRMTDWSGPFSEKIFDIKQLRGALIELQYATHEDLPLQANLDSSQFYGQLNEDEIVKDYIQKITTQKIKIRSRKQLQSIAEEIFYVGTLRILADLSLRAVEFDDENINERLETLQILTDGLFINFPLVQDAAHLVAIAAARPTENVEWYLLYWQRIYNSKHLSEGNRYRLLSSLTLWTIAHMRTEIYLRGAGSASHFYGNPSLVEDFQCRNAIDIYILLAGMNFFFEESDKRNESRNNLLTDHISNGMSVASHLFTDSTSFLDFLQFVFPDMNSTYKNMSHYEAWILELYQKYFKHLYTDGKEIRSAMNRCRPSLNQYSPLGHIFLFVSDFIEGILLQNRGWSTSLGKKMLRRFLQFFHLKGPFLYPIDVSLCINTSRFVRDWANGSIAHNRIGETLSKYQPDFAEDLFNVTIRMFDDYLVRSQALSSST